MVNHPPAGEDGADEVVREIPNDRDRIEQAEAEFVAAVEEQGYPTASVFALRLAFEEAVINALRHGHRDKPEEPVRVAWRVSPREVAIDVSDKGAGFDPDRIADPTLDENLDQPSGRGIMLMRAYMSSVEYNDAGNRVFMRYERPDE